MSEEEQIRKIVEAIYRSLPRRHVFLISITIEQVRSQDIFLEWFVNQFWSKIVQKLSEVKGQYPLIRIIGVIAVEGKVNKKQIPNDLCCSINQFKPEKMIELKLKNWTEGQICKWLEAYSSIDPVDIPERAQIIYEVTKSGVPLLVYDKLVAKIKMEV